MVGRVARQYLTLTVCHPVVPVVLYEGERVKGKGRREEKGGGIRSGFSIFQKIVKIILPRKENFKKNLTSSLHSLPKKDNQ